MIEVKQKYALPFPRRLGRLIWELWYLRHRLRDSSTHQSGLVLFSKDQVVIFKSRWNWQSSVSWSKTERVLKYKLQSMGFGKSSELPDPSPKHRKGATLSALLSCPNFHCSYQWLPRWASCTQEAWLLFGSLALSSESQKCVRSGNTSWTECSCLDLYYVLPTRCCVPHLHPHLPGKNGKQIMWMIYLHEDGRHLLEIVGVTSTPKPCKDMLH